MPESASILRCDCESYSPLLNISVNCYQIGNDIAQPDAILVRSFNLFNAHSLSVKAIDAPVRVLTIFRNECGAICKYAW
jgi:hypothetical protein